MKDIVLTANQIVLDRTSQDSYRVLWIAPTREEAFWIHLTGKHQIPLPFSLPAVESGLSEGRYAIIMDSAVLRNDSPGANAKRRRDEAWKLISHVVEQEPAVYRLHERSQLLKDVSVNFNVSVPFLYKLLRRYWTGGMTPDALLPNYSNCGKHSNPYSESSQRRGRKRFPARKAKNSFLRISNISAMRFSPGM